MQEKSYRRDIKKFPRLQKISKKYWSKKKYKMLFVQQLLKNVQIKKLLKNT